MSASSDEGEVDTVLRRGSPSERTRIGAVLRWTDAHGARKAVVAARCLLGSAERAEVSVADTAVSRIHAELDPRDDGIWVRDLGSKNGSYIDGVEIGLARLPEGGRLRVGDTLIRAEVDSTPAPVELWPADSFGPLIGPSASMRE